LLRRGTACRALSHRRAVLAAARRTGLPRGVTPATPRTRWTHAWFWDVLFGPGIGSLEIQAN
ncbi:MAG: hypothetical protein ACRD52_19550, partial [Candidatus Acidiferrales bacterium]